MIFTAQVKVMPLKELLDPQGKAVMGGLSNLGLTGINEVRIGKNITLQIEAATPETAKEIAKRWLSLNEKVFKETGKLMEKYNVEDLNKPAGGGEYPSQDGFGWTNGIYVALKNYV